jgi:hypothetical protein
MMMKNKIIEIILLMIILVGAFSVRLYKIDNPIADWHSWRQADTSAVSRNFLKNGVDLFHPQYDDLSNVQSGKDNPKGYRFVEFPFYNLIHLSLFKLFPLQSLEWWGRMLSILFSIGSIIFLYFLAKKHLGKFIAFIAILFFSFLPFNIYYSRVILPEPMMIFTSIAMIYFFDKWLEDGSWRYLFFILSIAMAAMSLLLKPFTGFLFIPMAWIVYIKYGFKAVLKPSMYLWLGLSLLPFILWRFWMTQYPEGIPASNWLFNDQGIRFKGAFFYWLFAERISKLILGYWGTGLLIIGLLIKNTVKKTWFFHWWIFAILIYFTVMAGGNVRHDYYQVLAIPILCIFLGRGVSFLLGKNQIFTFPIQIMAVLVLTLFTFAFSWYQIRGYYQINHPEIVEAGQAIQRLTPLNAKVIAPYFGDTAFLYQTNRQGWPLMTGTIESLIAKGASYYVSVSFDQETKDLMTKYSVVEKTDRYIILSLIKQ